MYLYKLTCVDGGFGWGETGAQAEMCAPNDEYVKHHVPGGWNFEKIRETNETFFLRHIILESERIPVEE